MKEKFFIILGIIFIFILSAVIGYDQYYIYKINILCVDLPQSDTEKYKKYNSENVEIQIIPLPFGLTLSGPVKAYNCRVLLYNLKEWLKYSKMINPKIKFGYLGIKEAVY